MQTVGYLSRGANGSTIDALAYSIATDEGELSTAPNGDRHILNENEWSYID